MSSPEPRPPRPGHADAPWTRTPGPGGGTCGAQWHHPSGAVVRHCGHPTALFPYYGFHADGQRVVVRDGDEVFSCFKKLSEIKAAALSPSTGTSDNPA